MSDQPASNQDEARAAGTNAGPGSRLRAARQARGLDVDRVAAELHLPPGRIAALERDDYEALPGSVFVMGYMRNYARLLRLDPEPLLDAYRAATPDAVVGQPGPVRTAARKAGSGHLRLALASLAIVLAAGGLWYYWWQQGRGIPQSSTPAPAEQAWTAPGTRTPTPALEAPGQTPAPNEPPAPPGGRAAEESPAEPSLAQAAPDLSAAAGETASGDAAPAAPPGAEDTGTAPEADASPDDAPGAPPEAETAAAPAASEREVVMAFSGPCWVDIRDSEGEFKLFGEMGKGDRRVLGGTPPYSVILGNTAAVSITVGGEPYDLQGIARGNVARFTLDPAGQP